MRMSLHFKFSLIDTYIDTKNISSSQKIIENNIAEGLVNNFLKLKFMLFKFNIHLI